MTTLILAIVLLLGTIFHQQAESRWFCEGRACENRCVSQDRVASAGSHALRHATDGEESISGDPAGCHCVPVLTDCDHPLRQGAAATAVDFPPAVLASVPFPAAAVFVAESVAFPVEYRGPPPATATLIPSGLRAPPAA